MVIAQLTLTLRRHPTLHLGHLIGIIGSWLVTLVLIETLDV
jgi:hypothetical protein